MWKINKLTLPSAKICVDMKNGITKTASSFFPSCRLVMSCHFVWSCRVLSCLVVMLVVFSSCLVVSCLFVLSCLVLSSFFSSCCLVLSSCPVVLSCPNILSCHSFRPVAPCRVLLCLLMSFHVLSCLIVILLVCITSRRRFPREARGRQRRWAR